jgi:hypothetical protein
MNFIKKLLFFESDSPAVRKQRAYKNLAKRRGLLSYNDIADALKDGEEIRGQKISFESVLIDSATILEANKTQDTLKLTDVVLFSPNNLNNHYIGSDELKKMVDEFNESAVDKAQDILNINHSQNIEDALGTYSNVKYDEDTNTIKGDLVVERFNNSKLQDMLAVLSESKDIQLGLSIEFTAEDYEVVDGRWGFTETTLVGLALTLTPSAPQTLTNLNSVDDTTAEDPTEAPTEDTVPEEEPATDVEVEENPAEDLKYSFNQELKIRDEKISNLQDQVDSLNKFGIDCQF